MRAPYAFSARTGPATRPVTSAARPLPEFEKPLSENTGRSYTIPARCYTDPEVHEQKKRVVLSRTWHYIGHASHVRSPGDSLTVQVTERPATRAIA